MANFKKYHNVNGKEKEVKVGFSFTAFFFPIIWSLYNRLWGWATACFAIFFITGSILSSSIESRVNYAISQGGYGGQNDNTVLFAFLFWLVVQIAMRTYLGLNGNKFKEEKLIQRGFVLKQ